MSERRKRIAPEFYPGYPHAVEFLNGLKKSSPSVMHPILEGAIWYLERIHHNYNRRWGETPWRKEKKKGR